MHNILVVEDESIIADDLRIILENEGFEVSGPVDNGKEALKLLEGNRIDLALLDINIRGTLTGVDVARELRRSSRTPFIFLTSYFDEKTLRSVEEVNPDAYIVKPFRKEEVLMNIRLALKKKAAREKVPRKVAKILIRDAGMLKPIDPDKIMYLKAESNYTKIKLSDGKEHVLSHTLKVIEEKLPPATFCRVHKSFIINFNFIELIEGNSLQVANQSIPIGRSYRDALFEQMEVL